MAGCAAEDWLGAGVGVEADVGIVAGFGEGADGVVVQVEVAAKTTGLGSRGSLWAGVSFARDAVLL